MKKGAWKKRIIQQMKELGTYSENYGIPIEILSGILANIDENEKQWSNAGHEYTINHINKAGKENVMKSPYYMNYLQLNDEALKYIKELGLSPTAMKRSQLASDDKDEFEQFKDMFQ